MRFARFRRDGETRTGVISGAELLDLALAAHTLERDVPTTIRSAFNSSGRANIERLLRDAGDPAIDARLHEAGAFVPFASADLAAPIDDPNLLLAIGMNYHDHVREMNAPVPREPYSFTKNAASLIGVDEPIVLPASNPDMVDLEGELVIVIGSSCYDVDEASAVEHIGGYTIANDVSARDWVRDAMAQQSAMSAVAAWGLNLLGKQFPTFCPLGPYIVTADEVANVDDLRIVSRINGEVFQSSTTAQMVFSPRQLVAYFSKFYRFKPGDLILTGTPAGVGFGRGRFFHPGDSVEIEIESLGTLRNPVAAR